MDKSKNEWFSSIQWYREKMEYNAICKDMAKHTRNFIEQFGDLKIPAEILMEKGLVNYMKGFGLRFNKFKREADVAAKNWQQQINVWLTMNNMTEKQYLQQFSTDIKKRNDEMPIQSLSPRLNGTCKANQRNSGSDYRQNCPSSSSCDLESPDSQKCNQRNSTLNDRTDHLPSFLRKYPSHLLFLPKSVNPASQNVNSAEFNANLSIDPKEVTPSNNNQESPVKKNERFAVAMGENMFKAVKLKESAGSTEGRINKLLSICEDCNLDLAHYPHFLKPFKEAKDSRDQMRKENSDSSNRAKSLKGKGDKKIDPRDLPSTSQKGSMEFSKSSHESICNRNQLHGRKRKHMESTQSVVKEKEEHQPSLAGKLKHRETTVSVPKPKEMEDKQQPSQTSKLKHMARTQSVAKSKEFKVEQPAPGRTLKHKESTQPVHHSKELKEVQQPNQNSKLNSDSKRICAMAPEGRNCDKNGIKKRESPDQSAMIAITSSKKERTSVYHGGRKSAVAKLKDMSMRVLSKALKHTSDPLKYINIDASFEVLEPLLLPLTPEKLHRIEEEKKYLLNETDLVWKHFCENRFKPHVHLKKKDETWRVFYERCRVESNEKLKNISASISASKGKPDRQMKFTTVDVPPSKRQKTDYASAAKSNGSSTSMVKPLPNSAHPSISRYAAPVPPKGPSNHVKPCHRTIKKDAPLMHKAKKTWDQLNRIHRN